MQTTTTMLKLKYFQQGLLLLILHHTIMALVQPQCYSLALTFPPSTLSSKMVRTDGNFDWLPILFSRGDYNRCNRPRERICFNEASSSWIEQCSNLPKHHHYRIRNGCQSRINHHFSSCSMTLFSSTSPDSENDNPASGTTSTTTTSTSNPTTSTTSTPNPTTSTPTNNEYSFFDETTIYTRAGSGGQGSSTYKKGHNHQNGPPDGGNGGKGGDVILELDESLNTLAGLARYAWRPNSFGGGGGARRRGVGGGSGGSGGGGGGSGGGGTMEGGNTNSLETTWVLSFRAENGADGGRQCRTGKNGKDTYVRVPPGTIVQEEIMDKDHPNSPSEPTYLTLGTITHSHPSLLVAKGGSGGEGSAIHSSQQRGVRRPRTPPQGGERKRLKLTLKVVADVALVAVPNAGKSTLLSKVTRAKPKIADYPFTTVVPNLGVWVPREDGIHGMGGEEDCNDYSGNEGIAYDEQGNPTNTNNKSLILCDVPGLIAGASEGVGLGHAFLRHVERCHVILHLLDATSEDVIGDYTMINRELLNYGTGKLARMPQVVVVNKLDVAFCDEEEEEESGLDGSNGEISEDLPKRGKFKSKQELEEKLKEVMPHSRLMWISAKEGEGVDALMERVAMFVKKVKEVTAAEEKEAADETA